MYFNKLMLSACAFVFCCALGVGDCLECYHCNLTLSSPSTEDPCKGAATLRKCQDPAICISAMYSYTESSVPPTITTFKTCYPQLGGEECSQFLKNIRTINPVTAKIEFSESCSTCTTNGCNAPDGTVTSSVTTVAPSTASTLSMFFINSVISLLANKLL